MPTTDIREVTNYSLSEKRFKSAMEKARVGQPSPPLKLTPVKQQLPSPFKSSGRLSVSKTLTFPKAAKPAKPANLLTAPVPLTRAGSDSPILKRSSSVDEPDASSPRLERVLSMDLSSSSGDDTAPASPAPAEAPLDPTLTPSAAPVREIQLQLQERRCPTALLTPFKAQVVPGKKRGSDEVAWSELCEGWEYRWGRERQQRFLDKCLGNSNGVSCYESVEIRAKDGSERYEVKVGSFVYYQYDQGDDEESEPEMTVSCVLALYADKHGKPRWKHDSFFSAQDMERDSDRWELPKDEVEFNREHELVYSSRELNDSLELIDGLCTVRQVLQPRSKKAVFSAISRCEREGDSFFWRYQIS